jgi:hypothetical protein
MSSHFLPFLSNLRHFLDNFKKYCTKRSGCLRRFGGPDKGFAQQRPGLQKYGGVLAWEWSVPQLRWGAE